eukprot:3381676-Amphidinium_carterae.5
MLAEVKAYFASLDIDVTDAWMLFKLLDKDSPSRHDDRPILMILCIHEEQTVVRMLEFKRYCIMYPRFIHSSTAKSETVKMTFWRTKTVCDTIVAFQRRAEYALWAFLSNTV